ncbi:type II toxin-antitoxin system VapB family antitoxin [Salinarimonas sp. NSM]|uniref:type II toxin-antitoxin system VapB family antitoxin n=1 Tax=Salinarimonas sp. NSM TaxID=3458003 RepID=UPI0040357ED7
MALFIRDAEVAAMADQLTRLTRAKSKTEAVRAALRHELERARAEIPLRERVAVIQEQAAKLGSPDRDFDMKAYMDEMWGDD